MKRKSFLVAILLAVVLCFVVSGIGYGEVIIPERRMTVGESMLYDSTTWWPYIEYLNEEVGLSELENALLRARVSYMMQKPTSFKNVSIYYDSTGGLGELFPKDSDTREKICILVSDNRGYFSDRSEEKKYSKKQ